MKRFLFTLLLASLVVPSFLQAAEVEEIVVSARIGETSTNHLTSAITILTDKELSRRGHLFFLDALRFVPGLHITQEGGPGALAAVRIRGAESDHTKVLIDGVEANSTSGGAFDFGGLRIGQIARVEIVRGGHSLAQGAGAVGGVIYITTKKEGASFALSGGSFGTMNLAANLGAKNDKGFYIHLGTNLYRTSGHDISVASPPSGADKENFFSGGTRVRLGFDKTFGKHRVKTEFSHLYVSSNIEHDDTPPPTYIVTDSKAVLKNSNHQLAFNGLYQTALTRSLGLKAEFRGTYLDGAQLAKKNLEDKGNLDEQKRTLGEVKIALDYSHRLFSINANLLRGWEQEKYFRPDSNSFGAVDSAEIKRYEALEVGGSAYRANLTAGVRSQDYNNSKNAFLWQVGAGYKPHGQEFVRLRVSYGTSIQEPSLLQLYGFSPGRFIPNPGLKPEVATSLDGEVDVDLSSLLKGTKVTNLTMAATGFALYIEDEITGFRTPINALGISKRRGVETEIRLGVGALGLIDFINWAATYTYTNAKMANGVKSQNRPKHIASLTMRTQVKQFSFDWDLSWQSNQVTYNGRIASYPLVNVQVAYQLSEKINLFVRGENLTNEKLLNSVGYKRRGTGVYVGLKGRI